MNIQLQRLIFYQTLLIILIFLICINSLNAQISQLVGLDVKCDEDGMDVKIEFDAPFNGIIYAKGYYKDPNCRFVSAFSGNSSYHFLIRHNHECSMVETRLNSGEPGMRSYEITIIVQHDPMVVDAFDLSRQLQCNWFRHLRRTVTHSPIPVLNLAESRVAYPGAQINVWMDVQKGDSPFAPLLSGNVPIGEKLTVSLYLNDPTDRFDLQVKRCHAYDAQNFTAPNTQRLALTDRHGCSSRPQLLSSFLKLRHLQSRPEILKRMISDRARTANVIIYGIVNAFRFPEQSDVYVSCNVEICAGDCDNACQPEVNSPDDATPIYRPTRPSKPLRPNHNHHVHHNKKHKTQQQIVVKVQNIITNNSSAVSLENDPEPEVITNNINILPNDSNETETPFMSDVLLNSSENSKLLQTINLNGNQKCKF